MARIGRPISLNLSRCAASLTISLCLFAISGSAASAQERAVVAASEATRIITLGTGAGPLARAKRSQTATLVQIGSRNYLVDAGAGVARQLAVVGIQAKDIHKIFFTHLHFDHVAGVAPLLGFAWSNGLKDRVDIYGPPATSNFIAGALGYLRIPEGINRAQLPPGPSLSELVKAHDIDVTKPMVIYQDDLVTVTAVENSHFVTLPADARPEGAIRSYSYRFDTPDRSIVFTGDTGPSENLIELAKGADVLVSEVLDWDANSRAALEKLIGNEEGQFEATNDHMLLEHLAPREIGKIATRAGVSMVVLHHIGMGSDSETDLRHYTQGVRDEFSGTVVIASDGAEY